MFFVRFVALIALAIWIGGMAIPIWWGTVPPDVNPRSIGVLSVRLACGLLILVSLFVEKFVGPPPRAFTVRAGAVILMLILIVYSAATGIAPRLWTGINIVLGLFLLSWYAHE